MNLFSLQRRLIQGDCRKWREVIVFQADDWEKVDQAIRLLHSVGWVEWRVVLNDQMHKEVARWNNGVWSKTGE